jgi:CheY-like chemotaxis protein
MRCDAMGDSKSVLAAIKAAVDDPYQFVLLDTEMPSWQSLIDDIQITASKKAFIILCIPPSLSIESLRLEGKNVVGALSKPLYPSQIFDMLGYLWQHKDTLPPGIITKFMLTKAIKAPVAEVGTQTPVKFDHVNVLLVEDSPVNQLLMKTFLEKVQCHMDLAVNGLEAVEKIKNHMYDLVFMDCQMPEMDGFEATIAIRAYEAGKHRHVPIVALTADAMQGDRDKCLKVGMDDYITKPVKPTQINEMIRKFAGKGRPSANQEHVASSSALH